MNTTEKLPGAPAVATTDSSLAHRAIGVIVLAFSSDPIARWAYADPDDYLTHFPAIVRAFAGKAFGHGTAVHVDGMVGAALWLPPGVHPDEEALASVIQRSIAAERQETVLAQFEQMARYHPQEPHWYLPLIGVDPTHQGKGHGSALLQHTLAQCDRDHVPAYLESTNPVNIPLYERHGFKVQGTIRAGSSPPMFPMLRAGR
jgi:ribosomal protein S18 acetylase RimI-like enzyme